MCLQIRIKAVLNRAGLDQTTSIFARVFELYSQDKTPLEVAIALGLKSEEVLRYHHEYYALLGCNEFTKVYLWVKDNLGHTRVITTSNFTKDIGYKEGRELSKVLNYSDGESGINYNSDTLWLLIRHNLGRKLLLFLEQNLSKLVCPTSHSKFTFDIINNS